MPKTTTHNLPHSNSLLRTLEKEVVQLGNRVLLFVATFGSAALRSVTRGSFCCYSLRTGCRRILPQWDQRTKRASQPMPKAYPSFSDSETLSETKNSYRNRCVISSKIVHGKLNGMTKATSEQRMGQSVDGPWDPGWDGQCHIVIILGTLSWIHQWTLSEMTDVTFSMMTENS